MGSDYQAGIESGAIAKMATCSLGPRHTRCSLVPVLDAVAAGFCGSPSRTGRDASCRDPEWSNSGFSGFWRWLGSDGAGLCLGYGVAAVGVGQRPGDRK